MCGIYGGFGPGTDWGSRSRYAQLIAHRGPDSSGFYYDELACLGNTRLAIQDLERGDQPFISDDGQVVVVQNGEIYNHQGLRNELKAAGARFSTTCDTEVILVAYQKMGLRFLSRLNGMFAIAIYDKRIGCLHLARDRLGVKPLFLCQRDGIAAFGSEIKVVLASSGEPPVLNQEALSDYLSFNYVPPPKTMFNNVRHVSPGTVVTLSLGETKESRWWDMSQINAEFTEYSEDWEGEFNCLLNDATHLRSMADVEVGAFLSGGLDSTSVVSAFRQVSDGPLEAFAIGFRDPRYNELPFAEAAASRFGVSLRSRIVEPDMLDRWGEAIYFCDQPHGDISFLPTRVVSEYASESLKVVLTGDGGDELFAGYEKYLGFISDPGFAGVCDSNFSVRYWPTLTLFSDTEKAELLGRNAYELPHSRRLIDRISEENAHQDIINRMLLIDIQLLLPGNNLVKPDRMGMSASIEARSPFLDYRMVEFALRTSGAMKLDGSETKSCMKRAVLKRLGPELTYRKKQMFTVPVGDWFKNTRRDYCKMKLDGLKETGWVNPEFVDKIFEEHLANKVNRTRELRALVALQLWRSEFLSGE